MVGKDLRVPGDRRRGTRHVQMIFNNHAATPDSRSQYLTSVPPISRMRRPRYVAEEVELKRCMNKEMHSREKEWRRIRAHPIDGEKQASSWGTVGPLRLYGTLRYKETPFSLAYARSGLGVSEIARRNARQTVAL